ncbi:MAG: B12-binding domain-containing radical SAM protein [Polyangiales bacterium]
MLRPKVLLVGIYDTNTVALAPQILRAYVEQFPIAERFEIETLDLSIFSQSEDEMAAAIEARGPSVVGFSTYIWNVGRVLALAKRTTATVILGGPQVNHVEPSFFEANPCVDLVVTGEGEETLKELLEHFAGERALDSVAGVHARGIATKPREVLADVDFAPSPIPRILRENPGIEWIAYETSRGCPFLCGFCTWGYSKRMRYHGLERVFADLDLLLAHPTLKRIYLCDSSILLEKPLAKAILRRILEKNRNMVLRYEFNAEHLDDEIVDLLLQLPENEFNFGVQTITPRALKTMRRPFHKAKFEDNYAKMARRTERTSITMDVIYGLPGDDLEGYRASLEYVLGFDHVKWILTNPLILLPGSDFYRDREKLGIVLRDEESCIVEATASFSREAMRTAIRDSFFVSVVFLHEGFAAAMKQWARSGHRRILDSILAFFESLPFELVAGEYPYLVPSIAADFRARNFAMHRVFELYPRILDHFHAVTSGAYASTIASGNWSEQSKRLRRFADEQIAREGSAAAE